MREVNNEIKLSEGDDINNLLEMLELEIKMCKLDLEILELRKPFWFQKKKLKLYSLNKAKLEKRVLDLETKFHNELVKLSNIYDK